MVELDVDALPISQDFADLVVIEVFVARRVDADELDAIAGRIVDRDVSLVRANEGADSASRSKPALRSVHGAFFCLHSHQSFGPGRRDQHAGTPVKSSARGEAVSAATWRIEAYRTAVIDDEFVACPSCGDQADRFADAHPSYG